MIIKNEHPKGFGALEDCPNKKLRSTLRLWLYTCLTAGRCMQQAQKQIPSFLVIPLWGGSVGIKRQSKGLGALGLYRIMEACIYAVFPLWVLRICRIMRCSFRLFFWRRFLFVRWVQLFGFCFLPLKNNPSKSKKQCAAGALVTKTMTEKKPCRGKPF